MKVYVLWCEFPLPATIFVLPESDIFMRFFLQNFTKKFPDLILMHVIGQLCARDNVCDV